MRRIVRAAATAALFAVGSGAAIAGGAPGDAEVMRLLRFWYGNAFVGDIARGADLSVDLTCDGIADRVVAWRDRNGLRDDFYQIALIKEFPGPPPPGWETVHNARGALISLRLEVGTGGQYALCQAATGAVSDIRVTVARPDRQTRARFNLPPACKRWLRIDDGMCDALWVGYDPAQQKFVLDRN